MKLIRVRAMLAAGIIAAAGTVTGTVLAASPASAASPPVVLVGCHGKVLVRPAVYDIGCMPSNEFVGGLSWTSWRSVAFGSGVLKVNNCTPSSSCGPSKFTKYPILVVLWRDAPPPSPPGRAFHPRILSFTGEWPPRVPVTQTFTLPAT